jgi:PhzF family phenazine biosynthesis protein
MKIFQVDAFTTRRFHGNPAAVVPMQVWPPEDATLQAIADENNLSETAFFVPRKEADAGGDCDFALRWFTPTVETQLCGHATLASAHILWTELGFERNEIRFDTKWHGVLTVRKKPDQNADQIELDFPALTPQPAKAPPGLTEALGIDPVEVQNAMDLICVLDNKRQVHDCNPDFRALAQIPTDRGVAITAPGAGHDYVCRFFVPREGINEDPFTGSLQCQLAPLWANKLSKSTLTAHQVSRRGGEATCTVDQTNNRVRIAGHAVTYLKGEITI